MKRFLDLTHFQIGVLALTLLAVFGLVYAPHFDYRFPFHIDEWHHVSESIRLGNYGEYFDVLRLEDTKRFSGMEIGFHLFLFMLSFMFDLVLVYQFLPAVWAVASAASIFFLTYHISGKRFLTAWLAVVFFAAIKSNVNITGIWFFTPLTFVIPFIYLYLYFFDVGFREQKIRYILYGLAVTIALMPVHSISVMFAMPALVMYAALHWRFMARHWRVFLWFLVLPAIGAAFYKVVLQLSWAETIGHLFTQLQFRYGWGVLELQNSLFDLYPWVGFVVVLLGAAIILVQRQFKRFALFLLLPLTVVFSMAVYRLTGVSFLTPYQRNVYYLMLSLPLLSALGSTVLLDYIQKFVTDGIKPWLKSHPFVAYVPAAVCVVALGALIVSSFRSYYVIPRRIDLYHVIEESDYTALKYLATLRPRRVMADPLLSSAIYPLTRAMPIGAAVFYGDPVISAKFTIAQTCEQREELLKQTTADFVLSRDQFFCTPSLIYAKDNVYIYEVR